MWRAAVLCLPFSVKTALTNFAFGCFDRRIAVLVSLTVARLRGARQVLVAGVTSLSL